MFNLPPDTPWPAVAFVAFIVILLLALPRILREVFPSNSRDRYNWWRDRRQEKQQRREQRQLERKRRRDQKARQKRYELKK